MHATPLQLLSGDQSRSQWPASNPHLVHNAAQLHGRLRRQRAHQAQPALQALQLDLARVGGAQTRR